MFETIQEGMGDPDEVRNLAVNCLNNIESVMRQNIDFIVIFLQDKLVTVFENGKLLVDYSLEEIRERAELEIVKQNRSRAAQNGHV